MRSDQLSGDQVRALRERIEPMADYLKRLQQRMAKQCFNDADPFTWQVREARAAVEALANTLAGLDIDGPLRPHGKPKRKGELHEGAVRPMHAAKPT